MAFLTLFGAVIMSQTWIKKSLSTPLKLKYLSWELSEQFLVCWMVGYKKIIPNLRPWLKITTAPTIPLRGLSSQNEALEKVIPTLFLCLFIKIIYKIERLFLWKCKKPHIRNLTSPRVTEHRMGSTILNFGLIGCKLTKNQHHRFLKAS